MRYLLFVVLGAWMALMAAGCGGGDGAAEDTAPGVDTAAGADTATDADTATGQDSTTPTGTVTAETCTAVLPTADLDQYLASQRGAAGTWKWIGTLQEMGAYDAATSTQRYAICAEVFRCENCGQWGQFEIAIFKANEAPPGITSVKGATTQLPGVGDDAWEFPALTGVVVWRGDYVILLAGRSGFVVSWSQAEVDALAPIVAARL